MAQRIGGGTGGVFVPGPGLQSDNTLDQQREQQIKHLRDQELVHTRDEAERVVDNVVRTLQTAVQNPSANKKELGRLIAEFQRENGLPVTGRIDANTFQQLKDKGLTLPPGPPSSPAQPTTTTPPQSAPPPQPASTTSAPVATTTTNAAPPTNAPATAPTNPPAAATTTQPATKAAPDAGAQRQARSSLDQQARARVDQSSPALKRPPSKADASKPDAPKAEARDAFEAAAPANKADRVIDPTRLLASLVAFGFANKKGNVEEAIKSMQASVGLPVTGKLDSATMEQLDKRGLLAEHDGKPPKTTTEKPVEAKQQVRRALNEVTSKSIADRDIKRDPLRPQAPTRKPTTSSEVAARAPTATEAKADVVEQARLDSVVATQDAFERGVQEAAGDPNAIAGSGETKGEGAGVAGAGGASGGAAAGVAGQGARAPLAPNEVEGAESATGNAKAGDDNFLDDARGNANVAGDGEGGEGGHWEVPPLSQQLEFALEAIARDDDGSGPVTYTWDVTFYRPGIYAAGQPAEEMWHVVVHRANAFDPVWQQAADAIASRMLYIEPDASPPTLDDFVHALRRARVR